MVKNIGQTQVDREQAKLKAKKKKQSCQSQGGNQTKDKGELVHKSNKDSGLRQGLNQLGNKTQVKQIKAITVAGKLEQRQAVKPTTQDIS